MAVSLCGIVPAGKAQKKDVDHIDAGGDPLRAAHGGDPGLWIIVLAKVAGRFEALDRNQ